MAIWPDAPHAFCRSLGWSKALLDSSALPSKYLRQRRMLARRFVDCNELRNAYKEKFYPKTTVTKVFGRAHDFRLHFER